MKTNIILILLFLAGPYFGYSQTLLSANEADPHGIMVASFPNEQMPDSITLFDIRHQAVYNIDILLFCYERMIPLADNFGLTLTGGILIWDPFTLIGEVGGLVGGPKNFLEGGIGYNFNPLDSEWNMALFRGGYRLQFEKGFLAKLALAYVNEPLGMVVPLIGIGYAF